jgi:protein-tyrosine-phosphatase
VADSHRVSDKPFFLSTLRLLDKHGLAAYAKSRQEQLTGQLMENRDLVICMNQIVIDEAAKIVALPKDTINWDIVDIGEGHRIDREHNRHVYEEDIYQEIVARVDELVCDYHLA